MLSTVCAFCGTAFRVTREQLEARAARVRCGKCNTVFDALAALTHYLEPVAAPSPEPSSAALDSSALGMSPSTGVVQFEEIQWPPIELSAPAGEEAGDAQVLPSQEAGPADIAPPLEIPLLPEEVGTANSAAEEAVYPQGFPPVDVDASLLAPLPELDTPAEATRSAGSAPLPVTPPLVAAKPAVAAPAIDTPAFDFGPAPRAKRSLWWLPLSFILLLLLLGQTTFYFRGAIALLFPELKPYISELCVELGCEVPLPRRAELFGIETSDLQADPANPGIMVLSATLRNRAAFPQAFPALELTLTNDRDQPLARRVLQVGDYLPDPPAAFAASSERQIRLHVEAGTLKASGYRLYLFFP